MVSNFSWTLKGCSTVLKCPQVSSISNFLQQRIQTFIYISLQILSSTISPSQHKTRFPTLLTEKMRGRNFSSCLSSHFHRDLISYPYFSSLSPIQSSPLSNCLHPLQHIDYSLPSSHHRQISVSIFLLPVHSYLLQSGF